MYRVSFHSSGFTLVEIMVSFVVIAVLATISLATFHEYQESALKAELTIIGANMATGAAILKSGGVFDGDYYLSYENRSQITTNIPGVLNIPEYIGGYVRIKVEGQDNKKHIISSRVCSLKVLNDDASVLTYRFRDIAGGIGRVDPALVNNYQGLDYDSPLSIEECQNRVI